MRKREKKKVIVWVDHELTKEERKNFSKNYPGERLCFRLRYPYFPLYLSMIAVLINFLNVVVPLIGLLILGMI